MFAAPTTLILGAGASAPYKFPVGSQLLTNIRHLATGSLASQIAFPEGFVSALERGAAPSIDSLIEERSEFEEVGKIAIAAALLPLESRSILKIKNWYHDFFHALTSRSGKHRQKVTVVTFNYDRSLEFVLWDLYRTLRGNSNEDAVAEMYKAVEFIHVYGSLGRIEGVGDTDDKTPEIPFGKWEDTQKPYQLALADTAAKSIHLIGREKTADAFALARSRIEASAYVCFLGFGFLPENLERLKLDSMPPKRLFSSGYQLTTGFRAVLRHSLRSAERSHMHQIHVGNPLQECSAFLSESAFFRAATTPGVKADLHAERLGFH